MTENQRFHELIGGCWKPKETVWETDKFAAEYDPNPTYSNAADILKRMKEKCGEERYQQFITRKLIGVYHGRCTHPEEISIYETYIHNTPALLRKAVEFLEEK